GPRSFSLKTSGPYRSLDEVRDTIVASAQGRSVRVRDIARVSWETQPWTHIGRFNGQRAVFVTANQKEGHNILKVQQLIDETLDRFEASLPARIKLERGFQQSRNVQARLGRLYTDFMIAITLVLITLLP